MMNINFFTRLDLLKKTGGDTSVINELKNALSSKERKININGYGVDNLDFVHFFNITRVHDIYQKYILVKNSKTPFILSPIYEDLTQLDKYGRIGISNYGGKVLSENLKELMKGIFRSFTDIRMLPYVIRQTTVPFHKQQKLILTDAQKILVNSLGEKRDIKKKYNISSKKFVVVPWGFDAKSAQGDKNVFINKYKLKNFILCVGRIEPKKNQLRIIQSLRDVSLPLVFIGELNAYHKFYTNKFLKEVSNSKNIYYLGKLERKMLLGAFAAAKVHVLASWFEAPGIVNFEAAVNNCNIVTTKFGYGREYFKNYARYCDPNNLKSIHDMTIKAYNSPRDKDLKKYIIKHFNWDKITPKIINIYNNIKPI